MHQDKLHYTIISLTNIEVNGVNEVEEVIRNLEEALEKANTRVINEKLQEEIEDKRNEVKGLTDLINWLKYNKEEVYGNTVEDWKPFGGNKKITVTIQPIKTCLLMLILLKLKKPRNDLLAMKKRSKSPAVKENQITGICLSNINKDGY